MDLFRSKDKHTETLRDTIFYVAAELVSNFDDRRMIFLRTLLASDEMLRSSNNPLFFEGLKLRMSAMDDLEFEEMSIFSQ